MHHRGLSIFTRVDQMTPQTDGPRARCLQTRPAESRPATPSWPRPGCALPWFAGPGMMGRVTNHGPDLGSN